MYIRKAVQTGFTLIELLVVIAVIGVLAGIVLIAIDPQEQINRGNDAKRKQTLSLVVNAVQAYYVGSGSSGGATSYPSTADLTQVGPNGTGDLKSIPTDAVYVPVAPPGPYDRAVVYTTMLSKRERENAKTPGQGLGTSCNAYTGTSVYYFWSSANGKIGYKCGAVPVSTDAMP